MVNRQQIEDTFRQYFMIRRGHYVIQDDGTIDIVQDRAITETHMFRATPTGKLPVKFGTVEGDFDVANCNIKTLAGFPKIITGNLYTERNENLSQLYDFDIQRIGGIWSNTYKETQGLLPMLVASQVILLPEAGISTTRLAQAANIINKYAGTGQAGDILNCRDQLVDAGLEGNAEW